MFNQLFYILVCLYIGSSGSNTLTIVGITFGCVLLFLGIVGICANRQKRKVTPNKIPISSRRNQKARIQDVPMSLYPRTLHNFNAHEERLVSGRTSSNLWCIYVIFTTTRTIKP